MYLLLIFLFLLPFYKIFSVEFVDGHDFLLHFHMIHILEKYLREWILLPRWISEATYGYGTPIFTFMWGVPYYLGALLHMIGLSYSWVFKVLILLPNLLSGIGLFLWLKPKVGKFSSAVASIVYIWSPYRFLDSFIRNAIGELFFFALFPFVLLTLDRPNLRRSIIIGMLFSALLIYSHQGLSLFGYPFFVVYIFFQYLQNRNIQILKKQLLILIGSLLITFFYWFPALSYQYLLPISEGKVKSISFPPLYSLLRSKWEGGSVFDGKRLIMSFQIGLGQLGIIFLSHIFLIYLFFKKKSQAFLFLFWLSIFWLSIFFLQPLSKWFWINIPLIINLQFPFRLLFFPMFVASVLSAHILTILKKNLRLVLGVLFTFAVIIANRNHLGVLNKEIDMNEFFSYQGTFDVGGEKLPKYVNLKEIEKENQVLRQRNEFTIIMGDGRIVNQQREKFKSQATLLMDSPGKIHIRRIYFPGWNIYFNGKKTNSFEKGNGIILDVEEGKTDILVEYQDTRLIKISTLVSLIFFLLLVLVFFKPI